MEYIHIKNLEKYHPGYRDRKLQWAKLFFSIVNGDPEFEIIEDETDKWRFIAMVCLELMAQKPLLNDINYWKKHFNLKKRPMSLTLNMLHNFLDTVTQLSKVCNVDKEEEKEKEKDSSVTKLCNRTFQPPNLDFIKTLKDNPSYKHINIDNELGKMDSWLLVHKGRQKTRRFIVNWLNRIDPPIEQLSQPQRTQKGITAQELMKKYKEEQ